MILDAFLSYFHFVAVFLIFGALAAEAFVIRLPVNAPMLRTLARIDVGFGVSAMLAVAAGMARVYFGLKDEGYYWGQPFFWVKMATFVIVGLISIVPTMKFLSWRNAIKTNESFMPAESEIKSVRRLIMIEVHVFALIPLFAALMARGL